MTAADVKRIVDSQADWPHYVTGAMQVVPEMVDTIVEDSTSPTGYRCKKVRGWALVVRPLAPSSRKRGRRIEPFGKAMVGGFKKRRAMQHHEIDYLEPEEVQPSGLEDYTDLVEKYKPDD